MKKTAFVTGATGFVGLNLVEQLVLADWDVVALHRPTSDLTVLSRFPVQLVQGDLLDPRSLERAVPSEVDAVFHVAADISFWTSHDARQTAVNVGGTENVLDAAIAARARRFVHTSTWNTFGLELGVVSEESAQLGGRSWINYNRTKFLAEQKVREAVARGLDAVILNPCHVMGRYDRKGWARVIIDLCTKWIPAAPPGAGTFCLAEEVAKAHIAAAERGKTGKNYLLGGDYATFLALFRTVGEVTGCRAPRVVLPSGVFRLAARLNVMLSAVTGKEPALTPEGAAMVTVSAKVVSDLAQRELGYRPPPLRTLIEDSYRWLEAEGLLRR
ncbi:MAG: NAD-dependent epimerase/dehydratase family protein [Kiloniellales bacterium]|nr:NAD-dependent epimerase/dehydratase family protein [Kiloniellales bacterium]